MLDVQALLSPPALEEVLQEWVQLPVSWGTATACRQLRWKSYMHFIIYIPGFLLRYLSLTFTDEGFNLKRKLLVLRQIILTEQTVLRIEILHLSAKSELNTNRQNCLHQSIISLKKEEILGPKGAAQKLRQAILKHCSSLPFFVTDHQHKIKH